MPVVLTVTPNVTKIRELRSRSRYRTQGRLAAAIGKHRNWVWAIENYDTARRPPSLATMCELADALDVPVDEILAA
jgi:transcriptional regulator with XRE-family HTH domain